MDRRGPEPDVELVAEQIDFYQADAQPFDNWLGTLLDETNDEPAATTFRAGREFIEAVFASHAPLGDVLEIAAGTGRLVPLYLPHARTVRLVDSSSKSLAIARDHIDAARCPAVPVEFVEANVFDLDIDARFDMIIFSQWLHHVPESRFEQFWTAVGQLLADDGRVIFDFKSTQGQQVGEDEIPDQPTDHYTIYTPVNGVSIRDHYGQRWRVIHRFWHPERLSEDLRALGWTTTVHPIGLYDNTPWATATR